MGERTLKCGDCGAAIVAPEGSDRAICEYCGSETILGKEPARRHATPGEVRRVNKVFLAILAAFFLFPVLAFCGLGGCVLTALRGSDAGNIALAKARVHPEVVAALGTPIEEGYFVSGSEGNTGERGSANLQIPVSGPKGSGTLYVVATMSDGEWHFSKLHLVVSGSGEQIDLLRK